MPKSPEIEDIRPVVKLVRPWDTERFYCDVLTKTDRDNVSYFTHSLPVGLARTGCFTTSFVLLEEPYVYQDRLTEVSVLLTPNHWPSAEKVNQGINDFFYREAHFGQGFTWRKVMKARPLRSIFGQEPWGLSGQIQTEIRGQYLVESSEFDHVGLIKVLLRKPSDKRTIDALWSFSRGNRPVVVAGVTGAGWGYDRDVQNFLENMRKGKIALPSCYDSSMLYRPS